MSWFPKSSLSVFERFCINVLKCGPIPKHIAFIMDGNRRYAQKIYATKTTGHSVGFDILVKCVKWLDVLGVKEATFYVLSIDNLKRSKEEVDALMNLARDRFRALLEKIDLINERGIHVRVFGDLSLLPEDLRKFLAELVIRTKHHTSITLNFAIPYGSQFEITNSVKAIVDGVSQNKLEIEDINEYLISQCLYIDTNSNIDLLIRTSGEVRLSDFLLWQIQDTQICFVNVLWPEVCVLHVLVCLVKYQRAYNDLKQQKFELGENYRRNSRMEKFLRDLKQKRMDQIRAYIMLMHELNVM